MQMHVPICVNAQVCARACGCVFYCGDDNCFYKHIPDRFTNGSCRVVEVNVLRECTKKNMCMDKKVTTEFTIPILAFSNEPQRK